MTELSGLDSISNTSIFVNKKTGEPVFIDKPTMESYAFTSKRLDDVSGVPSVKVGDTTIGASKRVQQWRSSADIYSDAEHIWSGDNVIYPEDDPYNPIVFRDHNYHKYFLNHGLKRMLTVHPELNTVKHLGVSVEQFIVDNNETSTMTKMLDEARQDIIGNYNNPATPYSYMTASKDEVQSAHYVRDLDFKLRDFQREAVQRACHCVINTDNDFLFSAPTRSGKTHTSLNIAKEVVESEKLDSSITVVVTGKADVLGEWKESCERHKDFEKFYFISKEDFDRDENVVDTLMNQGHKHIIVFFTLQDLAGSNRKAGVKPAHRFLTEKSIDLILADEAHWALFTRDGVYNEAIIGETDEEKALVYDPKDKRSTEQASQVLGTIRPKYGIVYITATPYNALLDSSWNFNTDNSMIVSKQAILEAHKKWMDENPSKNESDSPFYGIPQPYFFVIPTGMKPSELFAVGEDKRFLHRDSVKNIVGDMFGCTSVGVSPNIFADKVYRSARLGNGLMLTVSQKSLADDLEDIIEELRSEHGLDYKVINISSSRGNSYSKMNTMQVKQVVDEYDGRFIIITCDRAMTGVTLKKVDTVVFMRNTNSAQFFIQAAGRSGSPYVVKTKGDDEEEVKVCVKPNCATITFDPHQVVEAVRNETAYDAELYDDGSDYIRQVGKHLEDSPVFILDDSLVALHKMDAQDFLAVVRDATKDRPLGDMVNDSDININLDDIDALSILDNYNNLNASKTSVNMKVYANDIDPESASGECFVKGCTNQRTEGTSFCIEHAEQQKAFISEIEETAKKKVPSGDKKALEERKAAKKKFTEIQKTISEYRKKVRSVISLVSLYAVLNRDEMLQSMRQVIDSLRNPKNTEMARLMGINVDMLVKLSDNGVFTKKVDFAINEIEQVFSKEWDDPYASYSRIFATLSALSPNEIVNPHKVNTMLVDKMDFTKLSHNAIIDSGCKDAGILVEIHKRLLNEGYSHDEIRNMLWCIPTSGLTYVIIRDIYQQYGWDTDHILFVDGVSCVELNQILATYVSGDNFLGCEDVKVKELFDKVFDDSSMKGFTFDYCVSNPPYQEDKNNGVNNTANNIFHLFYQAGVEMSLNTVMIFPGGRWLQWSTRGTQAAEIIFPTVTSADWFSNQGDEVIFDSVFIGDGISIVTSSRSVNPSDTITLNGYTFNRPHKGEILPLSKEGAKVVRKICADKSILSRKKNDCFYGLRTYFVERNGDMVSLSKHEDSDIMAYLADDSPGISKRVKRYWINRDAVVWNKERLDMKMKWKIVSSAAGVGKNPRNVASTVIESGAIVGESWVILGSFDTKEEAENYKSYIDSPLVRFLIDQSKGGKSKTWGYFVPDLGDYSDNNPDIDWSQPLDPQLYKIFNLSPEEIKAVEEGDR